MGGSTETPLTAAGARQVGGSVLPVEVLRRNVFVHPFHEEDTPGLIDVIGVDNVLFGSDFPHPEGMADPLSFVDELSGCPPDAVAKVMGGNLGRLMNVA